MVIKTRPVVLGHRGAPRLLPENTLASFESALAAGLDGFELDLQKTADGVLAVHHDATDRDTEIATLTWRELHESNQSIPRIEEVLELLEAHPQAHANLELKGPIGASDGREEILARVLAGFGGSLERVWVSSFDPLALIRLQRLGSTVPLALLVATEEPLELLPCLPVAGVHPAHELVSAARVAAWHDQDLFVVTWTVNDEGLATRLLEQGVDGLIGDEPQALLAAIGGAG